MHTYIHTYRQTYIHTDRHTYIKTTVHPQKNVVESDPNRERTHAYRLPLIPTYIHTYINTYIWTLILIVSTSHSMPNLLQCNATKCSLIHY